MDHLIVDFTRPRPSGGLPRRDLIILPLIAVLTVLSMLVLAEAGSRIFWQEHEADICVVTDPVLGHRFKPNCQSRVKSVEGPWVTNTYNDCGYRTEAPCGSRNPSTLRIDLMGSSTAEGYLVRYKDTISATLTNDLKAKCGRDVQVENMGMVGYQGEILYNQLDDALKLDPDTIVLVVTPFDLLDNGLKVAPQDHPEAQSPELLRRLRNWVSQLRAVQVAQHYMFKDYNRFANLYLNYGDRADFLRTPFTPAWHHRLESFDDLLRRMQARLRAAGVPLVVVYVPSRAQAAFLAMSTRPPGIDPNAFGQAIGKIAALQGATFNDLSDTFSRLPGAGDLFFPADGHLTDQGDPIVGHDIAMHLPSHLQTLRDCK